MPDDKNNPITGSDIKLALLLNGIPQRTLQLEKFTAKAEFQSIESRPLGSTNTDIQKIPDGYSGSFEVKSRGPGGDALIDAYIAAKRNRIPVRLDIVTTTYYRDGTSKPYVYPNCQIDGFESTYERGSAAMQSFNWRTGDNRI